MFHSKNNDYIMALGRVKPTPKPKRVSMSIIGCAWTDWDDNTHCGSIRESKIQRKYTQFFTSPVEEFVAHKRQLGITYYQVKYVDYDKVSEFWVPPERFRDGPNRLKLDVYRLERKEAQRMSRIRKSLRIMAKGRKDYRIMAGTPGRKRRRVKIKKNEFQLETILDKKMGPNGQYLFFIKWQGWPESDNTWEPAQNLYGCTKELIEFEQLWHERQKAHGGGIMGGSPNLAMP